MTGPFHNVVYAIEKIFEDLNKNTIVGMGKWGADHLKTVLDDFNKKMLSDRGMSIETYDSIKYRYEQIEYPLTQLQKFFLGEPSDIGSYQAAMGYGDALQGYFSELREIAKGIDEEYEQASAAGGSTE